MSDQVEIKRRRTLINQLQSLEQEGRTVPGYALYLEKMAVIDRQMEKLGQPNSWGVREPIDKDAKKNLQNAIQEAAMAGEAYIRNVREAIKAGKKLSLKKGAPGLVNALQGILASDAQMLEHYDPSMELSLPELLEQSRTKTLILGNKQMDTVNGNQNARIPIFSRLSGRSSSL